MINETHDTKLRSWVASANLPQTDFPIQNLPFGVFEHSGEAHIGVAIGDSILDLHAAASKGLLSTLDGSIVAACRQPSLNVLMSLGHVQWTALRKRMSELLRFGAPNVNEVRKCLIPMSEARMLLPATIGDYTDFYASIYHATNVGSMFRPDNPLLPNYKYVPIGYHGRASSIVVSGTSFKRPVGQTKDDQAQQPSFGPSNRLDYELELGFFVGPGNTMGDRIGIDEAGDNIFGICLLNDWSARDIQKWEYQPLGPFLAKSFATSISPWIVTMEALEPFRFPAFSRPDGDPAPLPYLESSEERKRGGLNVTLEVYITTQKMRERGEKEFLLSRGNFREMYWTIAQMLTHHASNGCNLRPGDLMGSGTVSGPSADSRGCLLELTAQGKIQLPNGESRRFLEDGDEVVIKGYCERDGYTRIGLGECRGLVLSAKQA